MLPAVCWELVFAHLRPSLQGLALLSREWRLRVEKSRQIGSHVLVRQPAHMTAEQLLRLNARHPIQTLHLDDCAFATDDFFRAHGEILRRSLRDLSCRRSRCDKTTLIAFMEDVARDHHPLRRLQPGWNCYCAGLTQPQLARLLAAQRALGWQIAASDCPLCCRGVCDCCTALWQFSWYTPLARGSCRTCFRTCFRSRP